ncbi:sensor histidine kinase KdpD [Reichenbachiella sp. 5M10]|uniref:sensor histidine kinase n=1 Tax=Reichenbachiella sp. 5M10 TaxID=1889772 RepID=UPI0021014C7F|nr:HAMP domain-containing sensor histidine kinase [Reichenbachiella sp. 5M10]
MKTKIPISFVGNLYVFVGAFAIILLVAFSGGVWSAIYPWIISIPVLALLVVNRQAGIFWGVVSFLGMNIFGYLALEGIELPEEYDTSLRVQWYVSVIPGLLPMILFIAFVFESIQAKALDILEKKNEVLNAQKKTIEKQSGEMQKLIDEKEYIIRIMAHDLKNPLYNISSLSKIILGTSDQEQKAKFVGMIDISAENAQNLINKVLEMEKSGLGDLNMNLEKFDITSALQDMVNLMHETARSKQIKIEYDNRAGYCEIEADKIYISLIFENLLSNAIKFSKEGTKVVIRTEKVEEAVVVRIIDQGQGIKKEEEAKLFLKFSKLSARPTGGESSAGLGLSLVKRYVELLHGEVWYESTPGGGATFAVAIRAHR